MRVEDLDQIEFEITSLCNAGCPGCPRTQLGPGVGFELNTITLADLQSWMPTNLERFDRFKFSGNLGDPIVNPEFYDIVEWLGRTYLKRINIHTNGGVRTPEWWSKLGAFSKEGWDIFGDKWRVRVNWAIDGLEDTNHIYRVGVRWDHVWANLNAYLSAGGRAEWHFIAFEHNEHQIDQARALAEELGMGFRVRFAARNERSTWVNKQGIQIPSGKVTEHPHKKDIAKGEAVFKKARAEGNNELMRDFTKTMTCMHLEERRVFVAADQTLWPCCMLYDESLKTTKWAEQYRAMLPEKGWNDLRLHSMQDILDSEFYQTVSQRWNLDNPLFTPRCVRSCGAGGKFLTQMK